jgi:hypothetical protein
MIPGVCSHDPEKTVPCHSPLPEHNQGCGQKSDDNLIVFACSACHDVYDRRHKWQGKHITIDFQRELFTRALGLTQRILFQEKIIK